MTKQRIKLEDTNLDIVLKMSEGNPGALIICTKIFNESEKIDPDAIMGGLSTMLSMDTYGIYSSRIWMLYKDVCKESIVHTFAVLRACQLGFLTRENLNFAIDNYGKGIDIKDIYEKVKKELPSFNNEE